MKRLVIISLLLVVVSVAYPHESDTLVDKSVSTNISEVFNSEADSYALPDTSEIVKRNFDDGTLKDLRTDPALQYKEPPTIAESLWDRFLVWIGQLLETLFERAVATDWGRVLMYTVAMVVLIALIMMFLKVNAFKVFYSGQGANPFNNTVLDDNIHEMDFEKLIQEATRKKDYRLGIRMVFLYALKMLSDRDLIHWDKGKTNHDYLDELGPAELKHGFNELNSYFEYAWYGNFRIKEETFAKVQRLFAEWKGHLR